MGHSTYPIKSFTKLKVLFVKYFPEIYFLVFYPLYIGMTENQIWHERRAWQSQFCALIS